MKYLITGSKGQLGFDLVRELKSRGVNDQDIFAYDKEEMDITNPTMVNEVMAKVQPDVVFHCAAWTAVDLAEDKAELCELINVVGTRNITAACKQLDAKFVYISTDYTFDGTKDGFYEVDDIPNPQSVYGLTKYQGELEAKKHHKHFVVRVSWVFGINGHNFIRTMLRLAQTHSEVSVVADQVGSPTYTVDLARLLVDMVETEKYGTYHATNEGYCSWAEFAEYIFKVNNKDIKVNHITTDQYPTKAKRPTNSKLSKTSLDDHGFKRLPSWQDAVERYKIELDKENQ